LDISILGTTAFDVPMTSEQVFWMIFLRVGVRMRLSGVTVETMASGEIGMRNWTGEHGAAAVVVAEVRPAGNLE
jgi:hypothetical protein